MTTYSFSFDAPDVLLNMNDRTHWRKRAVQVKKWRLFAYLACPYRPGQPSVPPCFVQITLPVRDNRRRDPMNYVPTVKAIVDGLVDAGVWPDDDSTWVTVMEPKLEKRADRRVTVELVPR